LATRRGARFNPVAIRAAARQTDAMNWTRLLPVVVLALGLSWAGAVAAVLPPEKAAQSPAEEWLALVDAGKYTESWEQMAPHFRKAVGRRKWRTEIEKIRKPLGKLTERKLKSAEYSKELPGAPEGEYVVLVYETAFEHKPAAEEKVTLILGQDLIWRVAGYAVK
jgi:hypothetical protein